MPLTNLFNHVILGLAQDVQIYSLFLDFLDIKMQAIGEMVLIGKVLGAAGIKGEIKVLITEDFGEYIEKNSDKLKFYSSEKKLLKMIFKRKQGKCLIYAVENVVDRNGAEDFGKPQIFCLKEQMPTLEEEEFYHSDLIGLAVFEEEKNIGTIVNVVNFGAGDIIEIELLDNTKVMYPFQKSIFPIIEKDKIIVIPPRIS